MQSNLYNPGVFKRIYYGPLRKVQIQDLTTAQIKALWWWQIQDLKPVQIFALTPEQIQALKPVQIFALTPEQIFALTPEQIQALEPVQIQALEPVQIQFLTVLQIQSLTEVQISALTPEQISALRQNEALKTKEQVVEVSKQNPCLIRLLTKDEIQSLKPTQIDALTIKQIQSLTEVQIMVLKPDQIKGLICNILIKSYNTSDKTLEVFQAKLGKYSFLGVINREDSRKAFDFMDSQRKNLTAEQCEWFKGFIQGCVTQILGQQKLNPEGPATCWTSIYTNTQLSPQL